MTSYVQPHLSDFESFVNYFDGLESFSPEGYGLMYVDSDDQSGLLYFNQESDYEYFLKGLGKKVKKKTKKFRRAVGDLGKLAVNTATRPSRGIIGLVSGKTPTIGKYKTKAGKKWSRIDEKVAPISALVAATLVTGGAAAGSGGLKKGLNGLGKLNNMPGIEGITNLQSNQYQDTPVEVINTPVVTAGSNQPKFDNDIMLYLGIAVVVIFLILTLAK